jgi:hypothetical protein
MHPAAHGASRRCHHAAEEPRPLRNSIYQLVFRGELDARYQHLFTTVLFGRVRDDAQLYGFIERLAELGLELLSVQKVSSGTDHESEHRREPGGQD